MNKAKNIVDTIKMGVALCLIASAAYKITQLGYPIFAIIFLLSFFALAAYVIREIWRH